ncbi:MULTISPECIES: helix-turn-helix transcriptional regulator [Janthinobacterium]|uniref:MarR family transcriptional regulator n=1 Tax=Janthinobacterium violaceinigrum TaxID=2654252 RepID=A0A6I1HYG1_9BURK|nr:MULTISPECIES: MarR family transcriptional regulator [Janthinobacterium]KAB8062189.1 MarR family transcriptional regulator [Janthinobacterium violaceinigrum]MCX7293190.1 MarR family transcriptional regulator [Janthinobacterium sp.]MED5597970.1 MarR family transcriptional regulator [Janthinobacterium sp. P210006]
MNYTSKRLDNQDAPQTTERILYFIKTKGPVSTATLAKTLDMTGEAARQQVQKLVAAGLIEGRQEAQAGAGRPRQNWVLTEAGNARFPDTHAQLTIKLIGSVRQLFGEAGLDKLITQREEESRSAYALACSAPDLPTRLQQLATVRDEEGYMARVEADGKDWLLIEDHCPICAAARTCQGFCRSELQLFQEVVGPGATIVREQHLLTNAMRCIYRISPLP